MKREKVYPEWVQQQRTKGTTVKKVGNTYYLYKRTSKRVPGKKNTVFPRQYGIRVRMTGKKLLVKAGRINWHA